MAVIVLKTIDVIMYIVKKDSKGTHRVAILINACARSPTLKIVAGHCVLINKTSRFMYNRAPSKVEFHL